MKLVLGATALGVLVGALLTPGETGAGVTPFEPGVIGEFVSDLATRIGRT